MNASIPLDRRRCSLHLMQKADSGRSKDIKATVRRQNYPRIIACAVYRSFLWITKRSDTFQRAMDVILSTVKWKYALLYLDNFAMFSRTPEERIKHTGTILRLVEDIGVALKLTKCALFKHGIDYLRYFLRPGRPEVVIIIQTHSGNLRYRP